MFFKSYRIRILFILILLLFLPPLLIVRLYYLQIRNHARWDEKARNQHTAQVYVMPHRGRIYSRNQQVLASSTLMNSVYLNTDPEVLPRASCRELSRRLGVILDKEPAQIARLFSRQGHFPLARKITEDKSNQIRDLILALELPAGAIYFVQESKRHYPLGNLAGPLLGFTTYDDYGDNQGLAGLELEFDDVVRGSLKKDRTTRMVGRGTRSPIADAIMHSTYGHDLVLTIDESIQHVAEQTLQRTVDKYRAQSGVMVVMDCRSGEILASACYPAFDPNDFSAAPDFVRRNRAICDAIEPGSVMKIFCAAALIEEGRIEPDDLIDCGNGADFIVHRMIRDAPGHKQGVVTFREAFQESSNVGLVRAAQRLTKEEYQRRLNRFGIGEKTGVSLPGEVSGFLAPPEKWSVYTMTSMPMGYEVMASALQLVTAVAAIGNDGVLLQPRIVREIRDSRGRVTRRFEPVKMRRVISALTAKKVLDMMEAVVQHGTGKNAQIAGFRVAGKTGTAHKVDPETRQYSAKKYISSFTAILPADDPRLAIYCYIDEPHGRRYGGDVAAPAVKDVAVHALRVLGIKPTQDAEYRPDAQIVLDRRRQELQAASVALDRRSLRHESDLIVQQGKMPDLNGLTMREVAERLAPARVELRFSGSGKVSAQSPPPNTPLEANQLCEIVFEP